MDDVGPKNTKSPDDAGLPAFENEGMEKKKISEHVYVS
jgi:hypothetical protein